MAEANACSGAVEPGAVGHTHAHSTNRDGNAARAHPETHVDVPASGDAETHTQRINRLAVTDVNRICSGQVITQLATAVKELVENAVDAGATSVEVRLTEYGAECIEVSDNGHGIKAEDYRTVTAKSWTSKIHEFEDIYSTRTFGFRGEALAALCELSESVVIITRTADDEMATQLVYDRTGALVSQGAAARSVGTTVRAFKVFSPLPVRHREFLKSLRKQYTRLLSVLQAYAMIMTGVKLNVFNQITGSSASMAAAYSILTPTAEDGEGDLQSSGKAAASRKPALSTSGATKLSDTIVEVMGYKFFATLMPVKIDITDITRNSAAVVEDIEVDTPALPLTAAPAAGEDAARASHLPASDQQSIEGYVSKMGEGVGRSNNERQFVYLNGRPVDAPKLLKALNDVWRTFEMSSKPACVLAIRLRSGMYDINVTPDKREVLLVNEGAIIERLRSALTILWEPSRSTFKVAPMITAPLPFQPIAKYNAASAAMPPATQLSPPAAVPTPVPGVAATDAPDVALTPSAAFPDGDAQQGDSTASAEVSLADRMTHSHDTVSKDDAEIGRRSTRASRTPLSSSTAATEPEAPSPPREDIATTRSRLAAQLSQPTAKGRAKGKRQTIDEAVRAHQSASSSPPRRASVSMAPASSPVHEFAPKEAGHAALSARSAAGDRTATSFAPALSPVRASQTTTTEDEFPAAACSHHHEHVCSHESASRRARRAVVVESDDDDHAASTSTDGLRAAKSTGNVDTQSTPVRPGKHARTPAEHETDQVGDVSAQSPIVVADGPLPRKPRKRALMVDQDAILQHLEARRLFAAEALSPAAAGASPVSIGGLASTEVLDAFPFHVPRSSRAAASKASQASSEADGIEVAAQAVAEAARGASVQARPERAEDDSDRRAAEEALSRVLSKQDFDEMCSSIVGQFNLGFIVAGIGHDLYILDQHACDEKAQFEYLRENTIIHEQRLLAPRPIELTAGEELVIIENLEVFRRNGFHFHVDNSAPAGRRLQLAAVPFSQKTQFGDEDVRELASILMDSGYVPQGGSESALSGGKGHRAMPRIPKALAMFASRACRSAIMIGDTLNRDKMRRVVKALAGLEQPWSCPHGRPTMRHLVDLSYVRHDQDPAGPPLPDQMDES